MNHMPRAFILDSKIQKVQIGNTIFNLSTSKSEPVEKAGLAGTCNNCEATIMVPFKSMDGARLAIAMFQQNRKETKP